MTSTSAFTNLYYKRAVATAKPCYICHKPTSTVLATINTVDFLYTCDAHLLDPGFASQVGMTNDGMGTGGAKKMGLNPEEIAKVKAEYEERQKLKAKEKDRGKDQEGENKDKAKDIIDKEGTTKLLPSSSSTLATPKHQRYTLHRDMFALRLAEHRKRRQAAQAKELAPRLPGAPATALP